MFHLNVFSFRHDRHLAKTGSQSHTDHAAMAFSTYITCSCCCVILELSLPVDLKIQPGSWYYRDNKKCEISLSLGDQFSSLFLLYKTSHRITLWNCEEFPDLLKDTSVEFLRPNRSCEAFLFPQTGIFLTTRSTCQIQAALPSRTPDSPPLHKQPKRGRINSHSSPSCYCLDCDKREELFVLLFSIPTISF